MFLIGYRETSEDLELLDAKQVFSVNGRGYLKKDKIEPRALWLFAGSQFPINFHEKQHFYSEASVLEHSRLPRDSDFLTLYFFREADVENRVDQVG